MGGNFYETVSQKSDHFIQREINIPLRLSGGDSIRFFLYCTESIALERLIRRKGTEIGGIALNSMNTYSIIAGFTEGVTKTSVMKELNDSVVDGTICGRLLLPISLGKYHIKEGELVGFIGENGAGISTTIKMMSGILFPTAGSIRVAVYVPIESERRTPQTSAWCSDSAQGLTGTCR